MTILEQLDELKWPIGLAMTGAKGKRFAAGAEALSKLMALAAGPQWVPVAADNGPERGLEGEFLYVLLPHGKVTQAMWHDFFTDDCEGYAWGNYVDSDCIEQLPVQPTHYFTPPVAPAHAS